MTIEKSFHSQADAQHASPPPVLAGLDPDAQRVVRAAALFGPAFDVEHVARLLDVSVELVLEGLQRAADAGVPLSDHGDGQLELPRELVQKIEASILPSLRRRWRARLAETVDPTSSAPVSSPTPLDEGGRERALERQVDTVSLLVRSGQFRRAREQLDEVAGAIASLPRTPETHAMRVRAKLERARLRWLGAANDPSLTLAAAFELALEVRHELGKLATPTLRAELATTIAGIAYDLGDGPSLERAHSALGSCLASLRRDGATDAAATLLDDQAALELRLGRPSRAADLLDRSLEVLVEHAEADPTDASVAAALADTYHLLARLPIHGVIDTESPEVALGKALDHCRRAKMTYERLGRRRDVARVLETTARLEAKRGNLTTARDAFEKALRMANEIGDGTGLARITAGLAELFTDSGSPHDALAMLTSSIELNREKGSPIGLAFDERVLTQLEDAISAMREHDSDIHEELARTRARLVAAIEATSA